MMKKALLFCMITLAAPAFLASPGHAVLSKQEQRYCERKARDYADDRSVGNTVGGAIGGAVVGGILGGVIGGPSGGSIGTGAAIGAGVGAVSGSVRSSRRWKDYYWSEYNRCVKKYR